MSLRRQISGCGIPGGLSCTDGVYTFHTQTAPAMQAIVNGLHFLLGFYPKCFKTFLLSAIEGTGLTPWEQMGFIGLLPKATISHMPSIKASISILLFIYF